MPKPKADQILAGIHAHDPEMVAWARRQATNPNVTVFNTNRYLAALAEEGYSLTPELVPDIEAPAPDPIALEKKVLRELRRAITAEVDATMDALVAKYAKDAGMNFVEFKIKHPEWMKDSRATVRSYVEAKVAELAA